MTVWLDGLAALREHGWAATYILLIILWGGMVMRGMLERSFKHAISDDEYFSLSAAGWIVPAFFLLLFLFGSSFLFGEIVGGILSTVLAIASLFIVRFKRISSPSVLLALVLFAFITLRFAFLKDTFLPSYFDSAEHYRLIQYVLDSYEQRAISTGLTGTLYHLGYHALSAALSHFFRLSVVEVMLVFGQLVLALLPVSLFFIVRHETDSTAAALFTSLLAGVGFHMPAHLLNWGKYPALLSLVCAHFVLGLAYILYRKGTGRSVLVLLGVGMTVSAFIHLRTLVVYGLVLVAWLITTLWKRWPVLYRYIGFGSVLILLAVDIYIARASPTLKLLLEGYIQKDGWMLILMALLTLASSVFFTELTFLLLGILALLGLALFAPITLPVHGTLTLLDRPYVQMLLYLPLSLLGGLGLAGLLKWIQRLLPNWSLPGRFVVFSAFGLVLLNAVLHHDFYASVCCRFVSHDDFAAITWMDNALPADSKVLIASTNLYVTSLESPQAQTGVDAGIWIKPLISRTTAFAWQGLVFTAPNVHTELCKGKLDYIYVGGMPQSFDPLQLEEFPKWYQPAFELPSARVYKVIGCK